MAIYYGQRVHAGWLISESAPISALAFGYPCTQGLFRERHVTGWRRVTAAIHVRGGRLIDQASGEADTGHARQLDPRR